MITTSNLVNILSERSKLLTPTSCKHPIYPSWAHSQKSTNFRKTMKSGDLVCPDLIAVLRKHGSCLLIQCGPFPKLHLWGVNETLVLRKWGQTERCPSTSILASMEMTSALLSFPGSYPFWSNRPLVPTFRNTHSLDKNQNMGRIGIEAEFAFGITMINIKMHCPYPLQ